MACDAAGYKDDSSTSGYPVSWQCIKCRIDQIYNLYNPLVYSTGDVIDTWVYRAGLQNLQYSLATAVGLFKSVISVILIALGYRLADKFTGYKLF